MHQFSNFVLFASFVVKSNFSWFKGLVLRGRDLGEHVRNARGGSSPGNVLRH